MRCGYLAFGQGLPGDHRTAWIDLPLRELLGYNPPDLHRVYPPDLVVGDPRVRDKYNKKVLELLAKTKTAQKAAQLREMVKDNLQNPDDPPHTIEEVDALHLQINNERRDMGWKAAHKLRKKHTGAHPYTPKGKRLLATAKPVSYTHLRAHETSLHLVCRLLLEKK